MLQATQSVNLADLVRVFLERVGRDTTGNTAAEMFAAEVKELVRSDGGDPADGERRRDRSGQGITWT